MKSNYTISCYADLEREELRVKKRLKKQEETLKLKLKTLPEEIVTTGITRLVTGLINGNIFKSIGSIIKVVVSAFSNKKEGEEEKSGTGFMDIVKAVIKNKVANS
jgi:hypothetical protein